MTEDKSKPEGKNKNKDTDSTQNVYVKPTRGFSDRTNKIVGIVFVIFVFVCFIIRLFVGA